MLRQALPLTRQLIRGPIGPVSQSQWPGARLEPTIFQVQLPQLHRPEIRTDSDFCRGLLRTEPIQTQILNLAFMILTPSSYLEHRALLQPNLNLLRPGLYWLCPPSNLYLLQPPKTLLSPLRMFPLCLRLRLEARLRHLRHHRLPPYL